MIVPERELMTAGCVVTAVLLLVAVWVMLRRLRAAALRAHAQMRSELELRIDSQHADCCAQIAQLADNLAVLETSARQVDEAKGGLTRAIRAQAMQLLRAGMSVENASAALGVGRNEMRLIADVSKTLRV